MSLIDDAEGVGGIITTKDSLDKRAIFISENELAALHDLWVAEANRELGVVGNNYVEAIKEIIALEDKLAEANRKLEVLNKLKEFINAQKPLPADMAKILYDNLWELYEETKP